MRSAFEPIGTDGHRQTRLWTRVAVGAALSALALLAAGCGSKPPSGGGGFDTREAPPAAVTPAVRAAFVAYTQCMRSHGIHDFPDPTIGGGGISFETHGGPGSDLDRDNPSYQAASAACQSLLPGGGQPTSPPPPQKLAIEVEWARCMRAHGLPNFPDPNSQGAFDSSRMDDSSPAFTTASNACKSYESSMGPVTAVPGHG